GVELRSGPDRWLAFARRGRSPRRSAAKHAHQRRVMMKITWLAVTLSLGMASLAFAQQSASDQQMMKVRQAMGDEYAAAIAKKDAVAMADHYTVDVVTAGLCPEAPPVVGRQAKIKQFEAALQAGLSNYSSKVKEVRLLRDGTAWSTGVSEFTINGQRVRGTWIDILRRDGKEWRGSFQAFARTPCSPQGKR